MSVQIIDAAQLRALLGFEDLIEPVSRAFQDFSAGLAQCAIVTMFPASEPTLGDVYVKTGRHRNQDSKTDHSDRRLQKSALPLRRSISANLWQHAFRTTYVQAQQLP